MRLSPSQLAELVAAPGENQASIIRSLYTRRDEGFEPVERAENPRGGQQLIYFSLEIACALKISRELARIGLISGTPAATMAMHALREWTINTPQVGTYETPLTWAIAHIQGGGDMALAVYSAADETGITCIGALFDPQDPVIPAQPIIRIAVNLSDLLRPLLQRAAQLAATVQ